MKPSPETPEGLLATPSPAGGAGLIGATGYVGTTLRGQRGFDHGYRSSTIEQARDGRFDVLICAGAPAQKWRANAEPDADRASLARLQAVLATVRARQCVLISTVDVFAQPQGVDEATPVVDAALQPYGRHRYELERFVRAHFPQALIVRLPGLIGPGLRKNALFDLHNDNGLDQLDHRAVFQFYPMVNLWWDIEAALAAGIRLLHLTAAPLSLSEIARAGFGREFRNERPGQPARYDFRSRYVADGYQYDRVASLLAIRAYAQSEPRRAPLT